MLKLIKELLILSTVDLFSFKPVTHTYKIKYTLGTVQRYGMKIWTSEQNIAVGFFQQSNFLNVQELFIECNFTMGLESGGFLRDSYFYVLPPYSSFLRSPVFYALLITEQKSSSTFLVDTWRKPASHHSFKRGPCSGAGFLTTAGCQNEGTN